MKLTKKELKSILKECLLEIFQDQLNQPSPKKSGAELTSVMSEVLIPRSPTNTPLPPQQLPVSKIQNPGLQERVNNVADTLSIHDPSKAEMYRAILEDTALNTLQRQHEMGALGASGFSVGPVTAADAASDQAQLKSIAPGGDVSLWAKIAFGNKS